MTRCIMRVLSLLALADIAISNAEAQPGATRRPVPPGAVTGVDVALEGSRRAPRGGTARWLVTVYDVVGATDLRPSPSARIRLTSSLDPMRVVSDVEADAHGRALLELAIPEDAPEAVRVQIEARTRAGVRRRFDTEIAIEPAASLWVHAVQNRILPGGRLDVLGRLARGSDGRALADATVEVEPTDADGRPLRARRRARTDAAGLFAVSFRIPRDHRGTVTVTARHGEGERRVEAMASVQVDPPVRRGITVVVAPTRPIASPGELVDVDVRVHDEAGLPVEGARLDWPDPATGRSVRHATDAQGRARVQARAGDPGGLWHDESLAVTVRHPVHGEASGHAVLRVARVAHVASVGFEGGALSPSLPSRLYAVVVGIDGRMAEAAVPVELRGPRLPPEGVRTTTDASGIAVFELPPLRQAAADLEDRCGGDAATHLELRIGDGARASEQALCAPVDADTLVRLRSDSVRWTPGATARIDVLRAPAVARLPLVVQTFAWTSSGPLPLASTRLAPERTFIDVAVPADARGPLIVRARPLVGAEEHEVRGATWIAWVGWPDAELAVQVRPESASARLRTAHLGGASLAVAAMPIDAARALWNRIGDELPSWLGIGTARLDALERGLRWPPSESWLRAWLARHSVPDALAPAVLRDGRLVPSPAPSDDGWARAILRDPWRRRARFVQGRLQLVLRA
ncbi:MAG: hypothetical protein RMK74_14670, partial [Myxococcales bacterium]|nr:hypothetical protein [Myxococcales bacterium]